MKKVGIAAALFVCLVVFWFSPPWSTFRSFDNLERNAKKRVTGAELQSWALGLLAQYPTSTNFWSSRLGTNFPLRNLYHNSADVMIWEASSNSPAYVYLMWGGGVIGHCGFEIGPTNFVSLRGTHKWQDGVYFWTDQTQK